MNRYTYCPYCTADLIGNQHGVDYCPECEEAFYRNPIPCTGIILVRDGKILLTVRGNEPSKGLYDLPGGYVEDGEHPRDAAVREAKEELGVDVKLGSIHGMYMDSYGQERATLNIYYEGEITDGQPGAYDDVAAIEWVDINELPTLENISFANVRAALDDVVQKHQRNHA